jgi:type VI protein secretion system component VasK
VKAALENVQLAVFRGSVVFAAVLVAVVLGTVAGAVILRGLFWLFGDGMVWGIACVYGAVWLLCIIASYRSHRDRVSAAERSDANGRSPSQDGEQVG